MPPPGAAYETGATPILAFSVGCRCKCSCLTDSEAPFTSPCASAGDLSRGLAAQNRRASRQANRMLDPSSHPSRAGRFRCHGERSQLPCSLDEIASAAELPDCSLSEIRVLCPYVILLYIH